MPVVPPRYQFSIEDYGDVPEENLSEASAEVADFVQTEILKKMRDGDSPVKGEKWLKLSKGYAEEVHGGDREPHLEETGDMLDALRVEAQGPLIEVFIEGDDENAKASGHNQFPGGEHPNLPKRRFIPDGDDGQKFDKDIEDGIKQIVKRFEGDKTVQRTLDVEQVTAQQEAQARDILRRFDLGYLLDE